VFGGDLIDRCALLPVAQHYFFVSLVAAFFLGNVADLTEYSAVVMVRL
jgi:hypothetical protein